jgi:hypothetical protein
LIYWNIAPSAWRLVSQRFRQISSALMDLKNVSTMHCLTGDLHRKSADKGIVVAISFSAHRYFEAMLRKPLLIVM